MPNEPSTPRRRQQYMAEASVELLVQAKQGDELAWDILCERYIPILRRWATGRLPNRARDLLETNDIVQEAVIRALRKIQEFEYRREGALLAYLRQAVLNRIRDEARRVGRKPLEFEVNEMDPDHKPSPLEQLIGREQMEIYERAMEQLKPTEREAIIARMEMGMSFEDVAQALGKQSADAARMTVNRALVKLAEEMSRAT